MIQGFFPQSKVVSKDKRVGLVPKCKACGLLNYCKSPKMPMYGNGGMGILIVGEAPGEDEDEQGKPFVGKSGNILSKFLWENGNIKVDRDCWRTNACSCRPTKENKGIKNRSPTDKEINSCRPLVLRAIKQLNPTVIVPLGASAVKSVIGMVYKDEIGAMMRWCGWTIPCQEWDCWICPTWHPSYISRTGHSGGEGKSRALDHWFARDLGRLRKCSEARPSEALGSDADRIYTQHSPSKAAKRLRGLWRSNEGPICFDYETNCLKPETEGAKIVSCAVCFEENGKLISYAYPWSGDAVEATRRLLHSPVPKYAANLKFEERWTRWQFGKGVRNWKWDTMLAAHVLDNRSHITGLKFQAFVRFGAKDYDHHVQPFLKNAGKDGLNRVHEVELAHLLTYNAYDSLYEYKLAVLQMEAMENAGKA